MVVVGLQRDFLQCEGKEEADSGNGRCHEEDISE
jgi:hypothetical protein